MNFFQRAPIDDAEQARRDAAYQRGRADARGEAGKFEDSGLMQQQDTVARRAYERGRRDERARHPRRRGSPVLTTVLFLAACAGAFVIYLGFSQGSFTSGGQSLDQNVAAAKQKAEQASRNAADRAGDALQNAGQKLKQSDGNG